MNKNYTQIADLYAVAKAELDAMQKRVNELRQAVLETGKDTLVGDVFTVTVTLSERTSIDTNAVRQILTPAQLETVTRVTDVETLRIKASVQQAA